MTNQEITEFLEDVRVQFQLMMDEHMRPMYKKNTWLKQTDLRPTERIIMQLIDEIDASFTITQLVELTGLTRKTIRENLYSLADKHFIKRGNGHQWEANKIY